MEATVAEMPKKTREVFDYLKKCASRMRTVNYGEIAKALKMGKGMGVRYALGYIRDDCERHHRPWLNAIVVNADKWFPGESFLPAGVNFDETNERWLWRSVVLQVFAFDWTDIAIE